MLRIELREHQNRGEMTGAGTGFMTMTPPHVLTFGMSDLHFEPCRSASTTIHVTAEART